jgi:hypothetical protein
MARNPPIPFVAVETTGIFSRKNLLFQQSGEIVASNHGATLLRHSDEKRLALVAGNLLIAGKRSARGKRGCFS